VLPVPLGRSLREVSPYAVYNDNTLIRYAVFVRFVFGIRFYGVDKAMMMVYPSGIYTSSSHNFSNGTRSEAGALMDSIMDSIIPGIAFK